MIDLSDDPQPYNPGHRLEGLDRCSNISNLINDTLADHPAVLKAGAQGLVEGAIEQLTEAYRLIGLLNDDEESGDTELLQEALKLFEYVTWHDGRYRQASYAEFQGPAQKLVDRLAERLGVSPYQEIIQAQRAAD